MRPEAKKKGGLMFGGYGGGAKSNMKINSPKTRHGKSAFFAMGGMTTPNMSQQPMVKTTPSSPAIPLSGGPMANPPSSNSMGTPSPLLVAQGNPQAMAKGGNVKNPKMSAKVANFFAKKGEKKLASHEKREAAGMEEDTPAIAKREMSALKGAPAPMRAYESKEHNEMGMSKGGMACGGMKKYATGGSTSGVPKPPKGEKYDAEANDWMAGEMEVEAEKERRKAKPAPKAPPKLFAKGGGVESKGKTQGKFVKMASGGSVSARADGIANRGKTNCKYR